MSDQNHNQADITQPLPGPSEMHLPEQLPVLPLRNLVVFPFLMMPLLIGRKRTVKLVDEALAKDRLVVLATQKNAELEEPGPDDLHRVGVGASIIRMLRMPDDSMRVLIRGISRVRIKDYAQTDPYLVARIEQVTEEVEDTVELKARVRNLSDQFQKLVTTIPSMPDELQEVATRLEDPGQLADLVASTINIGVEDREKVLEEFNVRRRVEMVSQWLAKDLEIAELSSKIATQAQTEMTKAQREYYLRKQLEAIQKELGVEEGPGQEVQELRTKIVESGMSEEARKEAERELDRLATMHPSSAEYTVVRNYLDWLTTMPWSKLTEDNLDLKAARKVLDRDHYDLEKIKDRMLEYLGVRKLKPDMKGPILCFVGPPGVGKTSLGRSVAEALGRKFVRMSLGGIHDEAEIRGHRRTYVGALPGRIIQGIRRAESRNPVFMLDEIDKVGADFRGDPSSALLEVLDPEQNHSFNDNYLDVSFDLSKVMFITTGNILDTIPPALLDRMEVLVLPGYTEEEKVLIARKHLIPKELEAHGLTDKDIGFQDAALHRIIRDYTREAGLRNFEREIANICRKVARRIAEGRRGMSVVTDKSVSRYLGPVRFFSEVKKRAGQVGVATGLAWTQAGGAILFVESAIMRGRKGFLLTGQLGDVMKESAQAGLSYVRSHAKQLGIAPETFDRSDIHIHVPAGATPKDGPSAGLALLSSVVSLLTQTAIPSDIAMTGEITLTGIVLPVGGIKQKVLAAKAAGIDTIILPRENVKDIEEIPPNIRKTITFKPVSSIAQALKILFGTLPGRPKLTKPTHPPHTRTNKNRPTTSSTRPKHTSHPQAPSPHRPPGPRNAG